MKKVGRIWPGKYHNHTLQTNPLHREEETHSTNSPITLNAFFKQPSLSPPQRADCKTRNDTKCCTTKQGPNAKIKHKH